MKKNKPLILVVATVLIALMTSFLVFKWLKAKNLEIANQKGQIVAIAVATADLSQGMVIKPEMVKTAPFLKSSLTPSGYFTSSAQVEGRVVITPIKSDEPIFESRLASTDIKNGGVAAVIPTNKRAMAVRVDKVKGVSGFIHPGNRVDVVATFRPANSPAPVTMTVLESIPVLATGTETEIRNRQERPVEVDVITLELSPEEAEVLALAESEGKLQLSLRNFSDTKSAASTGGTTVSSLMRLLSGKEAAPQKTRTRVVVKREIVKEAVPQKPAEYYSRVQVIEGHKVDEVKFKEGSEE